MDICINCIYLFLQMKRPISYVFYHKRRVENFEKKIEMLKERRDRVQRDVDTAERNVEKIYSNVRDWLIEADKLIIEEAKEVKDLESKVNNKCFIGLCPNWKSRYQLSKKAEDDGSAVDLLLQLGAFDMVSFGDIPQAIMEAPLRDFESFGSRKKVFDETMEALKDPNINIVGVYGMAGVGKTVFVKEVLRQVQQDKLFDSVVMAIVTHTFDVRKIQDQIADSLGLNLVEHSVLGRACRLRERLKKEKKILIVLDDVWNSLSLEEVGIPFGDEHKGCNILLTSRDFNVLSHDMGADKIFQIDILKVEEALDLFKKMSANSLESPDLKPIAIKIAEKCAGLPIAISTVARALRGKELFEWKDALRRLQRPSSSYFRGIAADVYLAIDYSYNRLETEEMKQTFLLCGLVGHDASIRDFLIYAMGLGLFNGVSTVEETRDRLLTVMSQLKASCLLLHSHSNSSFYMHNLVRDFAKSIADEDNHAFALEYEDVLDDWPAEERMEGWYIISLRYAKISKLPDQLECPKLTFFCMASKDPSMQIPTNFFKKMKNLRVLDLTKLHFSSLPLSICQLANLRTLCLEQCVLEDISIIGELKNLEILSLIISEIEMLPMEIGLLIKLKLLDLSHCTKLKIIPQGVLSSLCKLEELYMGDSFVQWEAEGQPNASPAEFKAFSACLTALEVHIPNANIIPNDFFFFKLQRYEILIGEAWDWDGKIEESRTLKLELRTSIQYLSAGMKMLLGNAENVHIDERTGVEILVHELEDWKHFQEVKNLHIKNGASLKYIIKDDDVIGKIEFPRLKSLTLQNLPNLISFCSRNNGSTSISPQQLPFFNEKVAFPRLVVFELSVINVKQLFSSVNPAPKLTSLIMESCNNLRYLMPPSLVNNFTQLENLEICDCKIMEAVVNTERLAEEKIMYPMFPSLVFLRLGILPKFTRFYCGTFVISTLRKLWIHDCPSLVIISDSVSRNLTSSGAAGENLRENINDAALFDEKVAFPDLEELIISSMQNFKIFNDQFAEESFCKLTSLIMESCNNLRYVMAPSLVNNFTRLENLEICDCKIMEAVVDTERLAEEKIMNPMFPRLVFLQLGILPKFTRFYYGTFVKSTLRKLWIHDCPSLVIISDSVSRNLTPSGAAGENLQENINDAALFDNKVAFPDLEELIISSMQNFKIFNDQFAEDSFYKLNYFKVVFCENISTVFPFNIRERLKNLRELYICNCASLVEMFEPSTQATTEKRTTIEFPELTHLQLRVLPKWKRFCNNIRILEVPSLSNIEVFECPRQEPRSETPPVKELEALRLSLQELWKPW